MTRIVITGMGCVCPLGNDVPSFWRALVAGQSGIAPLTKIDTTGLRNDSGGEVQNFDWSDFGEEGDCDEASQFAFAAAHEAVADSHLSDTVLRDAGIVFSTNFGGAASWEAACEMLRDFLPDSTADQSTLEAPSSPIVDEELFRQFTLEHAADYTAQRLGIEGPRVTISNACSTGGNAIGMGVDWLRLGRVDKVLCGGHDGLGISTLAGLSILRTISPDLCRPFDKNRNGTIFGEGAAVLVLETWESAHQRNANNILNGAAGNDDQRQCRADASAP